MLDMFVELEYGKYDVLDLHGKTIEDAKAELLHAIASADIEVKAILVVHGFNLGTKLKKFVREQFEHKLVDEKVNIDAGRTLLKLKR